MKSIRKNNRKSKSIKSLIFATFVVTAGLTVALVLSNLVKTEASTQCTPEKYYKSISISYGDTIWNIAEENLSGIDGVSINEYISEVKSINNMINDDIKAGEKIVIPYYKIRNN